MKDEVTVLDYVRMELAMTNKHVLWVAFGVGILIGLAVK